MNLGNSLHIYLHLCVGIGLWLTLANASQDLIGLSLSSMVLLLFNLWRGWQKARLQLIPVWGLLLICVAWLIFDAVSLNSLLGVITLLTLSRLISARRSHEYNQLLLLTFGQVIFASTLDFELSFGLALLAYMIVITTALTLNHLHSEVERSVAITYAERTKEERLLRLQKRLAASGLIDKSFLVIVGSIASALCLGAIFLFFLFPRVGGQWYQGYQVGPSRSGFSGDITLGGIGEIQLDDRIAFRVQVRKLSKHEPLEIAGQLPSIDQALFTQAQGAPLSQSELYWRGRVLDHYQHGHWHQSSTQIREIPQASTRWINFVGFKVNPRPILVQQFYMDSRGHDTLFHLGQAVAVSLPMNQAATPLRVNPEGDLLYDWPGDLHYAALSFGDLQQSEKKTEKKTKDIEFSSQELNKYLQVPQGLQTVLKAYAQSILTDAGMTQLEIVNSPNQVAALLTQHLKKKFSYRLDQDQKISPQTKDMDPIIYFLTQSRAGHCEYFSTALTLLLRSLNIPARQITGYAGGEWSPLGEYYTVRQKDAHAWVEMWLGQAGESSQDHRAWLRLDPTPNQSSAVQTESIFKRFRKFKDHLQFMWFRYVLGFDTRDQMRAVNQTSKQVKASFKAIKQLDWLKRFKAFWLAWWKEMLALCLGVVFIVLSPSFRQRIVGHSKRIIRRLMLTFYQWWLKQEIDAKSAGADLEHSQLKAWQALLNNELTHLYEETLHACESLGLTITSQSTGIHILKQLKSIDEQLALESSGLESSGLESANLREQFETLEALYLRLRFSQQAESQEFQSLQQQVKAFRQSVLLVKKALASKRSSVNKPKGLDTV